MVDTSFSSGVDPTAPTDTRLRGGGQDGAFDQAEEGPAEHAASPRNIDDVVFLMGIPQGEVTPAVRQALTNIMGEFDRVRIQRDRLVGQVHHLEALADAHGLFPILNRRAFVRQLARILARAAQAQVGAALLYLAVDNGDDIRRRFGRQGLEDGLVRAAGVLVQAVRANDVVGSLDAGDFGVILAPIDPPAAEEKAAEIVSAVVRRSAEHGRPPLNVRWGLHAFAAGDTPDSILAAAAVATIWRRSGDNVWVLIALQSGDQVLEVKLPFFQPPQGQLVESRRLAQTINFIVQRPMLGPKVRKLLIQRGNIVHRGRLGFSGVAS